jgi:hypothetical protein
MGKIGSGGVARVEIPTSTIARLPTATWRGFYGALPAFQDSRRDHYRDDFSFRILTPRRHVLVPFGKEDAFCTINMGASWIWART